MLNFVNTNEIDLHGSKLCVEYPLCGYVFFRQVVIVDKLEKYVELALTPARHLSSRTLCFTKQFTLNDRATSISHKLLIIITVCDCFIQSVKFCLWEAIVVVVMVITLKRTLLSKLLNIV